MTTVDHAGTPATDLEYTHHAEAEDREAAATLLRARVMPNLDHELAIGIAHAVVGAWNAATLDRFLSTGER